MATGRPLVAAQVLKSIVVESETLEKCKLQRLLQQCVNAHGLYRLASHGPVVAKKGGRMQPRNKAVQFAAHCSESDVMLLFKDRIHECSTLANKRQLQAVNSAKQPWEKETQMEQRIPAKRGKGAASSSRVKEILDWYKGENAGTLTNLARMLNHGTLAGTGKMVILPVDQGFEHGPARSFAPNDAGYHPHYHFQLAIDAGCNAYAAPLGFLEAGAAEFAGQIPLILKLNNSDSLLSSGDPCPAVTGSVQDALRLGCCAIGYTIYPGSAHRNTMYEDLRQLALEAKEAGLVVVVWSYPRGSGLSKEGETAIDVAAYAAQIAAQLGAHVIKVKPPSEHIEQDEARKVYEKQKIPIGTLAERVHHVVQSAFDGRRVVIFSGGAAKGTEEVLEEIQGIRDGGGFGSIIGRNSFQRPKKDALSLLSSVMDIYLK